MLKGNAGKQPQPARTNFSAQWPSRVTSWLQARGHTSGRIIAGLLRQGRIGSTTVVASFDGRKQALAGGTAATRNTEPCPLSRALSPSPSPSLSFSLVSLLSLTSLSVLFGLFLPLFCVPPLLLELLQGEETTRVALGPKSPPFLPFALLG